MAERMARVIFDAEGLESVRTASRGLLAAGPKQTMAPDARTALKKLGFEPGPHAPRQVDALAAHSADWILPMADLHAGLLVRRYPEASAKVVPLNRFSGLGRGGIDDPKLGPPRRILGRLTLPDLSRIPWVRRFLYDRAARRILAAVRGAVPQLKAFLLVKGRVEDDREARLGEIDGRKPNVLRLDQVGDDEKGIVGGKSDRLDRKSVV